MKILRMPEVKLATGYKSNTSIYQRIRQGIFPKPIRIGDRSVGWFEHEIAAYVSALARGSSKEKLEYVVRKIELARLGMTGE